MATTRRYAEGTKVSVDSSRGELTGILAKHGVQRMGWMGGPEGDELMFELGGGQFRLKIAKPTLVEIRRDYPNAYDEGAKLEAEWRRRWRANVRAPSEIDRGVDRRAQLRPHENLPGSLAYTERKESAERLCERLAAVTALSANASPQLVYLLEAMRRVAGCSFANRRGEPYYARKRAIYELRGCLDEWQRSVAA